MAEGDEMTPEQDLLERFAKTGVLPSPVWISPGRDELVYAGEEGSESLDPNDDLVSAHAIVVMLQWLEGQGRFAYAHGSPEEHYWVEDQDGSIADGTTRTEALMWACIAVSEAKEN